MRTPNNESLTPTTERTRPGGKSPERKCILTGRHGEREDLIRLAISPDGQVLPDPRARAPGRGAWLGVSRAELEAAIEKGKLKGALARAFKSAPPLVPEDLPAQIEAGPMTFRLGVDNFTDEEPSYPQIAYGDILGRRFWAGAKLRFW